MDNPMLLVKSTGRTDRHAMPPRGVSQSVSSCYAVPHKNWNEGYRRVASGVLVFDFPYGS